MCHLLVVDYNLIPNCFVQYLYLVKNFFCIRIPHPYRWVKGWDLIFSTFQVVFVRPYHIVPVPILEYVSGPYRIGGFCLY